MKDYAYLLLKTRLRKSEYTDDQQEKIHKVMKEFKDGVLKTSAGDIVTDKQQAIAIALSEAKNLEKAEKDEDLESLIREHRRLVEVLESEDHEDDKEEAKVQKKELKEYERLNNKAVSFHKLVSDYEKIADFNEQYPNLAFDKIVQEAKSITFLNEDKVLGTQRSFKNLIMKM